MKRILVSSVVFVLCMTMSASQMNLVSAENVKSFTFATLVGPTAVYNLPLDTSETFELSCNKEDEWYKINVLGTAESWGTPSDQVTVWLYYSNGIWGNQLLDFAVTDDLGGGDFSVWLFVKCKDETWWGAGGGLRDPPGEGASPVNTGKSEIEICIEDGSQHAPKDTYWILKCVHSNITVGGRSFSMGNTFNGHTSLFAAQTGLASAIVVAAVAAALYVKRVKHKSKNK